MVNTCDLYRWKWVNDEEDEYRIYQPGSCPYVDDAYDCQGNSNIVRITPPLSEYSTARLVAGSFRGYTGNVDGKPTDARFDHPKGVAMDDKGNVYVADTSNLAIRKIGGSGVTTIAGGKSNTEAGGKCFSETKRQDLRGG